MRLKEKLPQGWLIAALIVLLLVIDQVIKIAVKTSMTIGEHHDLASWCQIYFIENPGMAYGITLGSKLFLTIFRIIAMALAIYFVTKLIRMRKYSFGFLVCLALVVAGGLGNIIDSIFYGQLFSESSHEVVARFLPSGGGYASLFHGKVVDMFYFPLFRGTFPSWLPFWGGENFEFFRPVFNFADSCITVGVALLLIAYPRTLSHAIDTLGKRPPKQRSENDGNTMSTD